MKKVLMLFLFVLVFSAVVQAETIDLAVLMDASISNYQYNGNLNNGGINTMYFGKATDGSSWDMLLKFDLTELENVEYVEDATLNLFFSFSMTGSALQMDASLITENWDESSVTWNNQPNAAISAFSSAVIDGYSDVFKWFSIDITDAINAWKNGSSADYGILLSSPTEALKNQVMQFRSSEYSQSVYHPYVTVNCTKTVTPEPISFVLFSLGLGVSAFFRRIRG